jgi:hypothetical protein
MDVTLFIVQDMGNAAQRCNHLSVAIDRFASINRLLLFGDCFRWLIPTQIFRDQSIWFRRIIRSHELKDSTKASALLWRTALSNLMIPSGRMPLWSVSHLMRNTPPMFSQAISII